MEKFDPGRKPPGSWAFLKLGFFNWSDQALENSSSPLEKVRKRSLKSIRIALQDGSQHGSGLSFIKNPLENPVILETFKSCRSDHFFDTVKVGENEDFDRGQSDGACPGRTTGAQIPTESEPNLEQPKVRFLKIIRNKKTKVEVRIYGKSKGLERKQDGGGCNPFALIRKPITRDCNEAVSKGRHTYLANSPWVRRIDSKENSSVRMTTTKSHDKLNRLMSIQSAPSSSPVIDSTYLYNNAKQLWNYTWDGENRLVRMISATGVGPQQRIDFEYDWQGRRIGKKVWNNTTGSGAPALERRFLYDGWNLVAELDGANSTVRTYHWGLDLSGSRSGAAGVGGLIAVGANSGGFGWFAAYDGNGNVMGLVHSTTGQIEARYEYGPFGESIRSTGTSGLNLSNPFHFSSKYEDDETGYLYYGYRYYNPVTGRWPNGDSIGESGGVNLYRFVIHSAVAVIDPLGEDAYKVACDRRHQLSSIGSGIESSNPQDLRLSFLNAQECILPQLCSGVCYAGGDSAGWLNRVVDTSMGHLLDALHGTFNVNNAIWASTFSAIAGNHNLS